MIQRPLLMIELQNFLPPPAKSAHCDGVGIDSKGVRYAVKFASRHPALPATEAFCHELARATGLRVPDWFPVQHHRDRRIGFGSYWLHDSIDPQSSRVARYWNSIEPSYESDFFTLSCVIDGFLFNPDRHFGNFLLTGASRLITKPFAGDYSCAWWMSRWMDQAALGNCNSSLIYAALKYKKALKPSIALQSINTLREISSQQICSWFSRWPEEWNRAGQLEDIIEWWDSPHRLQRLTRMESQIKNGQLPL